MIELPVSGWRMRIRTLTGAHESLLLDTQRLSESESLATFFGEIVEPETPMDWRQLPISDADVLALGVRASIMGDAIQADARCPVSECRAKIDLTFSVDDYLDHHAPRPSKQAMRDEDGWFCLDGVRFRPPTLADEIATLTSPDQARAIKERCMGGHAPGRAQEKKIEAALEKLAPSLVSELDAVCPECGESFKLSFDPRAFVLRELREQAAYLDNDIHLVASTYHWSMKEILDLPRSRRIQFVERIRVDRVGGEE